MPGALSGPALEIKRQLLKALNALDRKKWGPSLGSHWAQLDAALKAFLSHSLAASEDSLYRIDHCNDLYKLVCKAWTASAASAAAGEAADLRVSRCKVVALLLQIKGKLTTEPNWVGILERLEEHCLKRQHDWPHLRQLRHMEAPHKHSTLFKCAAACREGNFSLTIVSTELRCWCALATPDSSQQLQDSACAAGGKGAAVFYQDERAATHKCKVVPTPLTSEGMSVDYNQHNLEFTPAQGAGQPAQIITPTTFHLQKRTPWDLSVRDSDEYNSENKGDFEEIDVEFLNADPGVPNSVWFNSYHRGLSRGERLTKPEQYQQLLGLPNGTHNGNTFLTYTMTWQPSHVTWAINGVPLLRRTTGELVRWSDMKGRPFERVFVSPVRPMHIAISMWNDNSRFHFGGELDYYQSPFYSFFRDLRRIACDDPLSANNTQPYGPTWLYRDAASWPKAPMPPYVASPLPSPNASPAPSPSPSLPAQPHHKDASPSPSSGPQTQPLAAFTASASPAAKHGQVTVAAQSPFPWPAPNDTGVGPSPARPASTGGQAATMPPAPQAAPASSATPPGAAPASPSAKDTAPAAITLPSRSAPGQAKQQVTSAAARPAAPTKPAVVAKQQSPVLTPSPVQVTLPPQQQPQRGYKPDPTEPLAPATDSQSATVPPKPQPTMLRSVMLAPITNTSSSSSAHHAAGVQKSSGARRGRRWLQQLQDRLQAAGGQVSSGMAVDQTQVAEAVEAAW